MNDDKKSLWTSAVLSVLQARSADRTPDMAVEMAVNYADELIGFLERREVEQQEKEQAELTEVRALFPLEHGQSAGT